jgi:ribosomal-protein-alanine N-acetyltransferase
VIPPLIDAGPAHAAALAEIHGAAFAGLEIWRASDFRNQLALPNTAALIDPRGGMVLARAAADEAEILTIGVTPQARRRGIGARLLGAATDWSAGRGAATLFLEVAATDPVARAFYAAAGFTEIGLRPRYYVDGRDALVLRLNLCARSKW